MAGGVRIELRREGHSDILRENLKELSQAYRSVPEVFDLLAQSALALRKPAEHHMALAQSYNARQAYLPAIEQAEIAKRYARDNYYLLAEPSGAILHLRYNIAPHQIFLVTRS